MTTKICPQRSQTASSGKAAFCGRCHYAFPIVVGPTATIPASPVARRSLRKRVGASLRRRKTSWFAINGAVGCFLAALLAKWPPPVPPTAPMQSADILFTLDITGGRIGLMESHLYRLANPLSSGSLHRHSLLDYSFARSISF